MAMVLGRGGRFILVIAEGAGRSGSPPAIHGVLKAGQFLGELVQSVDKDARLTGSPADDAAVREAPTRIPLQHVRRGDRHHHHHERAGRLRTPLLSDDVTQQAVSSTVAGCAYHVNVHDLGILGCVGHRAQLPLSREGRAKRSSHRYALLPLGSPALAKGVDGCVGTSEAVLHPVSIHNGHARSNERERHLLNQVARVAQPRRG
eukprot:scaffold90206_cov63-Phaeocystis_antarctica.AAC.1